MQYICVIKIVWEFSKRANEEEMSKKDSRDPDDEKKV